MNTATAAVEAVEVEVNDGEAARIVREAEYSTPWAAGVVEFQKPWSDSEGDGDSLQGYCLGNGTTLVIHFDGFRPKAPTVYLLSDHDARTVRDCHRAKHCDLDYIETLHNQPYTESLSEALWTQDLSRDVTPLPMHVSQPLKAWPEEVAQMTAKAARREQGKRDREAEMKKER